MLKINEISIFFIILGPILSVGGSKPEIFIDGTPAPECEKAPAESPLRVTSIEREVRSGEKPGSVIVNFYSRKQNGTCPATESSEPKTVPIPKLNGPCTSAEFCQSIKFSNCSDGLCKCLPGYVEGNGQCFGKLNSNCSTNSDCDPKDSFCSSGSCQCPETHYFKNGNCYAYATRVGFPVHSSVACQYLKHSTYSSGSCQCDSGFVESNGQCLGKLGSSCSADSDCVNRNNICVLGTCQCSQTYYLKNGICILYNPIPAKWNKGVRDPNKWTRTGSDSGLLVAFCRSILNVANTIPGKLLLYPDRSTKCCIIEDNAEKCYSDQFETMLEDGISLDYSPNSLRNPIYGGQNEYGQLYLICLPTYPMSTDQVNIVGRLDPPSYDYCRTSNRGIIYSYNDFQVVVST